MEIKDIKKTEREPKPPMSDANRIVLSAIRSLTFCAVLYFLYSVVVLLVNN